MIRSCFLGGFYDRSLHCCGMFAVPHSAYCGFTLQEQDMPQMQREDSYQRTQGQKDCARFARGEGISFRSQGSRGWVGPKMIYRVAEVDPGERRGLRVAA